MFIDTVQDYYATYVRQMRLPYDSWREQSYHETMELRELRESARRRFIGGAAAVIAGVAAATNGGNYASQVGGISAASAGAYLIKSGFDKRAEAQMHMEALEELGPPDLLPVAPIRLQGIAQALPGLPYAFALRPAYQTRFLSSKRLR
jgi:hypothetical protein